MGACQPQRGVPRRRLITAASPERILELRAAGLTYAQIAAEVGLSVSRVGEVVRADERRRILGLS